MWRMVMIAAVLAACLVAFFVSPVFAGADQTNPAGTKRLSLSRFAPAAEKAAPAKPGASSQPEISSAVQEARMRPYEAAPQAGPESIATDGASMVLVQAGAFTMGENAGAHRVYLDAFFMDKYEVTAARYARFLKATEHKPPAYWDEVNIVGQGDRPVVGVDWHDAEAYCRWAGNRLPTEAEWEKAARGPEGYFYPWGNDEPSHGLANYDSEGQRAWKGYATLAPVGSYEAGKSPYGIYDMAGNVWEWVSDWYSDSYYTASPGRNPKGPSSGWRKVVRGGSWYTVAPHVRSTYRLRHMPSHQNSLIGFRCAMDAPP